MEPQEESLVELLVELLPEEWLPLRLGQRQGEEYKRQVHLDDSC